MDDAGTFKRILTITIPVMRDVFALAFLLHGYENKISFPRKYSLFDRSKYYWGSRRVKSSLQRLLANLRCQEIPMSLLSQFLPFQYNKIRQGLLNPDPLSLIKDKVTNVLDDYSYAVEKLNIKL